MGVDEGRVLYRIFVVSARVIHMVIRECWFRELPSSDVNGRKN